MLETNLLGGVWVCVEEDDYDEMKRPELIIFRMVAGGSLLNVRELEHKLVKIKEHIFGGGTFKVSSEQNLKSVRRLQIQRLKISNQEEAL